MIMTHYLTEDTKAIILLCGVFRNDRTLKPLSQAEYSLLVKWLLNANMRPGDLLKNDHTVEASNETGIEIQRLKSLINRGANLGFAVEEWQRGGIWIISRSDEDYPCRLKKHLKDKAPPLLYGAGDRRLLKGGGIGIVGSRNVDQQGEEFTRKVAELCAMNQMPVVSGGARGVDQISMNASLEAGGETIGIVADDLLRKSVARNARYAIAEDRLLIRPQFCIKVKKYLIQTFSVVDECMVDIMFAAEADHFACHSFWHNEVLIFLLNQIKVTTRRPGIFAQMLLDQKLRACKIQFVFQEISKYGIQSLTGNRQIPVKNNANRGIIFIIGCRGICYDLS